MVILSIKTNLQSPYIHCFFLFCKTDLIIVPINKVIHRFVVGIIFNLQGKTSIYRSNFVPVG